MFVIYGTSVCPWCDKAKDFLHMRAEPFTFLNIEQADNLEVFKSKFPGAKAVPQITYGNLHIQGYEALRNLWYSGPREFWPEK